MNYDDSKIPEVYNRGRDHGPAFLKQWMDVLAFHFNGLPVRDILDLGCGTGRFSPALAAQFDANVFGLDSSRKMLNEAKDRIANDRVCYACGTAEAIPLRAESVDVIFISMVFHHFTDPNGVALECRRVLRKHGRLCLRTASAEQIPAYPYLPFFPTSRILLDQRLPSIAFQRAVFQSAQFRVLFEGLIRQQIAQDFSEYADKLSLRADSILRDLNDADFESGLDVVRSHAASPQGKRPVVEPIDFIVFEVMG